MKCVFRIKISQKLENLRIEKVRVLEENKRGADSLSFYLSAAGLFSFCTAVFMSKRLIEVLDLSALLEVFLNLI